MGLGDAVNVKLEHWISSEHLQADAMSRYHRAIHHSHGRAAIIDNLLLPDKLAVLRELFSGDGRFEPTCGLFNRHPHEVPDETFDAAPEAEQFYRYRNFRGPMPGRAMAPGMVHNALFTMLSRTPAWRAWLASILGAPLAKQTGMHARIMSRGMFMKRHDDDAHGSLCAIFYLSPGWERAFGSCFVQEDKGERVIEVAPLANRLLLFSPRNGLSHGVAPMLEAAGGWERWSYSLWYGSEDDGAHA